MSLKTNLAPFSTASLCGGTGLFEGMAFGKSSTITYYSSFSMFYYCFILSLNLSMIFCFSVLLINISKKKIFSQYNFPRTSNLCYTSPKPTISWPIKVCFCPIVHCRKRHRGYNNNCSIRHN